MIKKKARLSLFIINQVNNMTIKASVRLILLGFLVVVGFFIFSHQAVADTVVSGPLHGDETWTVANSPYLVPYGDFYRGVDLEDNVILTIEPGVVVKFERGAYLSSGGGKIMAVGTKDQPIIFTSIYDDTVAGDTDGDGGVNVPGPTFWQSVNLLQGNSQIENVEVRYGSSCLTLYGGSEFNIQNNKFYQCGGMELRPNFKGTIENNEFVESDAGIWTSPFGNVSSLTVKNNKFLDNAYGMYIFSPVDSGNKIEITGNQFSNKRFGVYAAAGANIAIHNNNFEGNPEGAVLNGDTTTQLDATNNWWGNKTGPYNLAGNPEGLGAPVGDGVIFDPWLGQEYVPTTGHNPVLIIPGIMGTEIYKGEEKLWPDITRMFATNNDRFMDPIGFDLEGEPLDASLTIGNVLSKEIFLGKTVLNYTDKLINELIINDYEKDVNLFIFPYDWRKELDGVVQNELKQKINDILIQTNSQKIDVIAHSQGGLIIKRLVFDDQNIKSKIDKLVFVGTPNLGAPKAAKALLFGDSMGVNFVGMGLDPAEVKRISQNMPSVYELLPSLEYFSHGYNYLGIAKTFGPFKTGYSILNYDDTKQTLKDLGLNSALVDRAETFHSSAYDNYSFPSGGIKVSNIIGCQEGTVSEVLVGKNGRFWLRYGPGDGTVPVASANNIFGANVYFAKKSSHGTMMTDEGIRQLVVNLISGSDLDIGGDITQNPLDCRYNGRQISVHSPVELNIYDENGNHVGPNTSGNIDLDITGAQYDVLGDDKFAFLPEGHTYTVKLVATDSGSFDFYSSIINDGEMASTAFYNDIPINDSSVATVILTGINDSVINLDMDNDGNIDKYFGASANLDPGQSNDLIYPVTTASLMGSMGDPGFYRSNVSLILSAEDPIIEGREVETSGVLHTKYSLDGADYEIYSGPIAVINEGTHTLKFFSTDNAGNDEEEKSIVFTIDKTAPEATIKFSPEAKDIIFSGFDNISFKEKIKVEDSGNRIVLIDEAGNITEVKLKDKNRTLSMRAQLLSISYNGAKVDLGRNSLLFAWLYNPKNVLKSLTQSVYAKKGFYVLAVYDGKKTKLVGLDSKGIVYKSISGLILLNVTTNKGDLKWSY
jgi:triacylglycerol esterase/lipase EstA (alpha/beta hydrolase family)